jgi:hypothetical protein
LRVEYVRSTDGIHDGQGCELGRKGTSKFTYCYRKVTVPYL